MGLKSLGVAIGLGLMMIGTAHADTSAAAFLKKVNANADNTLSMKEVDAYASKRFDALNTNKDDTLSMEELKGHMSEADFGDADTTHKSKKLTLSRAEFMAYVDKLFVQANTHVEAGRTAAQGTLSVKELETPAGKKLIMLLD